MNIAGFNANNILVEQPRYYLTNSKGDKGFLIFPKDANLKVNVLALLEFELTHFKAIVQHVSY